MPTHSQYLCVPHEQREALERRGPQLLRRSRRDRLGGACRVARRPCCADATGGNQGFSQLVCLLGDFSTTAPPAAMQHSLVLLLAHLSQRYNLSTWKDATNSFVSRGSNRWPAGRQVEARTISGHRDMTFTACPGNAAYGLLDDWRARVHPIVAASWVRPGLQPAVRSGLEAT